jgi:hypothetical protein
MKKVTRAVVKQFGFLLSFILLFAISNTVLSQGSNSPLCYGVPINLICNLPGCNTSGATYHWENFSGSWSSDEANPVILPGTVGYASDKFYLSVQYPPPPGSFSGGRTTVYIYPAVIPTITGPSVACLNSSDKVYTTETGKTNYIWIVTGGTITAGGGTSSNSVTVSWNVAGAHMVSVNYNNNYGCSAVTPTVYNVMVGPPIVVGSISPSQTICVGDTPVVLTCVAPSNGTMPTYQWQSSLNNLTFSNLAGATMQNYQPPVLTSTTYFRQIQNAIGVCEGPLPTNTATITVNQYLPVGVLVSTISDNVCDGIPVTFTATPSNGGLTPAYQWIKSGTAINGATDATYTYFPVNGDVISCMLASSEICNTGNPATSNAITMTVNPLLPVSISVSASANNICAGTSVTFTATPVNGGLTPAYQWKKGGISIAGATNMNYSYIPVNGNVITCVMTSSEACKSGNPATSNAITMTVNPILPVSIAISVSANNVYPGTLVTFTSAPVNGGFTPGYQWKKGGISITGATNSTYTYSPECGDLITCLLTSSATCITGNPSTSNSISMLVKLTPTISGPDHVCNGSAGNVYTTESGMTDYTWEVSSGGVITNGDCPNPMFISESFQNNGCYLGHTKVSSTGNSVTVTWNNSGAQNVSVNYTDLNGCSADLPSVFPVTVFQEFATGTILADQTINYNTIPDILTGTPPTGGNTPYAYQWRSSNDMLTFTNIPGATNLNYQPDALIATTGFQLNQTSGSGCGSENSNIVTVTVNPAVPAQLTLQNENVGDLRCFNATQTILVAGPPPSYPTTFVVGIGGHVTMIAGHNIIYYAGTSVNSGGYLHALIAPNGPWCATKEASIAAVPGKEEEINPVASKPFFSIFPNPTTGNFSLELKGHDESSLIQVEIYGILGERVLSKNLQGQRKFQFSLNGQSNGVYFVRVVISGKLAGTGKIIKQ